MGLTLRQWHHYRILKCPLGKSFTPQWTAHNYRRSKKKTCLASGLKVEKSNGGGAFFFSLSKALAAWLTHFPKQPAGLLNFQDGCQFFVLMGPTWTLGIWTSVYLGLDLEKDPVFFFVFLTVKGLEKKKKAGGLTEKEAGGDAKHVFFLLRLKNSF